MTGSSTEGGNPLRAYIGLAAGIEDAVAAIYDQFAERFSKQEEFALFWRLSAEAERYHSATIRLHGALLNLDQPVDEAMMQVDLEAMSSFLARLEGISERCAAQPCDASQALDLAIEIESNGCEVHGRTQFAPLYPGLAGLFEKLAEEDRAHRRSFAAARQRFHGTMEGG